MVYSLRYGSRVRPGSGCDVVDSNVGNNFATTGEPADDIDLAVQLDNANLLDCTAKDFGKRLPSVRAGIYPCIDTAICRRSFTPTSTYDQQAEYQSGLEQGCATIEQRAAPDKGDGLKFLSFASGQATNLRSWPLVSRRFAQN